MKRDFLILLAAGMLWAAGAHGQSWLEMRGSYQNHDYNFPLNIHDTGEMTTDGDTLWLTTPWAAGTLSAALHDGGQLTLDSLTLADSLAQWGRDKYQTFALHITTAGGRAVESKETYVDCAVQVDTRGQYPQQAVAARIRGRGNSTWLWYPKKPYRLKFQESNKLLGIDKNKDWVLLANYRDVSMAMNAFCLLAARQTGVPWTSPVRFAEVFLNGAYQGVYQVAEQVETGGNRVDVEGEKGLLLCLDVDDGPGESPDATDNFWSSEYGLPVCVKYPDDPTADQLEEIVQDFGELERAIKTHDYEAASQLMDLESYIAMLQLQEFTYNVELLAPRSFYVYRDTTGRWGAGPAWDWDAAFDFEWSDMYTGHTYFGSYTKTMLGSDPYNASSTSGFFSDLFGSRQFAKQYKEQWAQTKDSLLSGAWTETLLYTAQMEACGAREREAARWPMDGFDQAAELDKMDAWLRNRWSYMDSVVNEIPEVDAAEVVTWSDSVTDMGSVSRQATLKQSLGYNQGQTIDVTESELCQLMAISADDFSLQRLRAVPLNADGTTGTNTAAGTYGAWFDADGNTIAWSQDSRVYLEGDNALSLTIGLHPDHTTAGDSYHVAMRYDYAADSDHTLAVTLGVDVLVE